MDINGNVSGIPFLYRFIHPFTAGIDSLSDDYDPSPFRKG